LFSAYFAAISIGGHMRKSGVLHLFVLIHICSATAFCQQTAPSTATPISSDPQAVSLIQRSLAVLSAGAPVADVTLSGTVRRIVGSDDETGTANLEATALGDSRVDLALPSGNRSEVRNHSAIPLPGSLPSNLPTSVTQVAQAAGTWSGPDGTTHPVANHNAVTDASWFFPVVLITKLTSTTGYTLTYLGPENLNGVQVLHIQASQPVISSSAPVGVPALLQHLSLMDVYIDPTALLPVALGFNIHPDDNALSDIPTLIEFSGYQTVSGIQVPFHLQKYINNGLVLDIQVNSVKFNSGLGESSFQIQ
jgi:hypothetical protein